MKLATQACSIARVCRLRAQRLVHAAPGERPPFVRTVWLRLRRPPTRWLGEGRSPIARVGASASPAHTRFEQHLHFSLSMRLLARAAMHVPTLLRGPGIRVAMRHRAVSGHTHLRTQHAGDFGVPPVSLVEWRHGGAARGDNPMNAAPDRRATPRSGGGIGQRADHLLHFRTQLPGIRQVTALADHPSHAAARHSWRRLQRTAPFDPACEARRGRAVSQAELVLASRRMASFIHERTGKPARDESSREPWSLAATSHARPGVVLTWRRSIGEVAERRDSSAALAQAGRSEAMSREAFIERTRQAEPGRGLPAAALPVAAMPMDGSTVDRLAEDIIRRIEKRSRIERERGIR